MTQLFLGESSRISVKTVQICMWERHSCRDSRGWEVALTVTLKQPKNEGDQS